MSAAHDLGRRFYEAATACTAKGFRVFPCHPGKKFARIEGWQQAATTDERQIKRWATLWPDSNIGIAAGPMLDVQKHGIMLDADLAKQGVDSLQQLVALGLPDTLASHTPSGGEHRFYTVPAEVGMTIGNSVGKLPGYPGIDMRANGGLVIAPGSDFEGKPYRWANDLPIAEAPDWLVDLVRAAKAPKRTFKSMVPLVEADTDEAILRATEWLRETAPEAIEGEAGDITTFKVGARVRDFGVSHARTFDLVSVHWNEAGKASPAWTPEELMQKVDNAFAYAQNPFGIRHSCAEFDVVTEGDPVRPKPGMMRPRPFVWRDPSTIPPREFLYGRHLTRGYISATVAHGGVGKTSLALVDAVALASGRNLIGDVPDGKRRVWYWNGEDPHVEVERRLQAAMILHKVGPGDIGDRLFMNSGRDDPFVIAKQTRDGCAIMLPQVENMVRWLLEEQIDLFVIDPFISAHQVNENDNNAIDAVTKAFAMIAHRANCAGELVHHLRKTNGAEASVEDARGGSALLGTVRSARVLNVMTRDEGKRLGVDNYLDHVRVSNGKANMSRRRPVDQEPWFKMESIPLGNGDEVQALAQWTPSDPMEDLQPSDLLAVQEAVATGDWRKDAQAKTRWVGIAIAIALRLDVEDEKDKARIKSLLKGWLLDGSLIEQPGRDEKRNLRAFVRVGKAAVA